MSLHISELQLSCQTTKGQLSQAKRGLITALRKVVKLPLKSWFGFALVLPEVLTETFLGCNSFELSHHGTHPKKETGLD